MFAYGNLSHGTDKIVLRLDIKEALDLKKVAVMVGRLPQIMIGIYLEKNGLPFDSVEYVNVIMDQATAARSAVLSGEPSYGSLSAHSP